MSIESNSSPHFLIPQRFQFSTLLMALLFCLALGVRFYGLSFGLPYYFSPDEVDKREVALHLSEKHFIHPSTQPSFLYNSLHLIFSLAARLNAHWSEVHYHYLGRLWIAVLGALTVVIVYRLGLLWDKGSAFIAAVFLAILPLHTACSRYIKEDIPLTLMTTTSLLGMIHYLRKPSRANLLTAALLTGVSFSTKYSGLLLVFPFILALLVSSWQTDRQIPGLVLDIVFAVLAFWIGFFLFSPIYLLRPLTLIFGLLNQWKYSATSHHDGIFHDPWSDLWLYYIQTALIPGMTWPLFLLSIAGLALLISSPQGWLVTATTLWLYLVFEHGQAKPYPFSARYLLPLAPLLCLSAPTP